MIQRHSRFAVGAASLMAAASIAIPGIAGATTPSTKAPKPDFAYFAGKTITLIEPSPPATVTNATGVDVGQFLDTYLHATVNVQYVAVNGVIGGANEAAAASANGLTIGFSALSNDLLSLVTGPDPFTFNFKKVEWLGAIATSPLVLVSCNPSIKSWSQVVKSKSALTIVGSADSANMIRPELMAKMFNFPAKALSGFPSSTAQLVGCQQGDGDVALLAFSQALNAGGTALIPGMTPLLSLGSVPKISTAYSLFSRIPTLNSYLSKHPMKMAAEKQAAAALAAISSQTAPSLPYFVAPGTPMPYVLALQDALAAAYKNPAIKADVADVPDPNVLLSANAITTWVNASLKTYGPEIEKVNKSFGG
jgi:hypothetical protein